MHSKMTGHTVSTTCTICSNEVEMFIKKKKQDTKSYTRMKSKFEAVLNKM